MVDLGSAELLTFLILGQLALGLFSHWMWRYEYRRRIRTEEALCQALVQVDQLERLLRRVSVNHRD